MLTLVRVGADFVVFEARIEGAQMQGGTNRNKAACALANKLARICYATLRDKTAFDENSRINKKMQRQTFVMPA